jgi:acetyl esterase/lipase
MALYRGMDRTALDTAYNNAAAVPGSAQIVAGWEARSATFRQGFDRKSLDLRYGEAERNRIDLFEAAKGAPLLAYIHGGYWQGRSKEIFSCLGAGPLAHGISVAMIGYTLAPEKRLDGIVAEIHAALSFLAKSHAAMFVSGWSAGGHLTAMAMPHAAVRGGLAISGIYDLEPIRLCYLNEKLRLDEAEARRNSPLFHPAFDKPLIVAYGGAELPELRRQSEEYARVLRRGELAPLAGLDHFSILEELAAPAGALTGMVRGLVGAA